MLACAPGASPSSLSFARSPPLSRHPVGGHFLAAAAHLLLQACIFFLPADRSHSGQLWRVQPRLTGCTPPGQVCPCGLQRPAAVSTRLACSSVTSILRATQPRTSCSLVQPSAFVTAWAAVRTPPGWRLLCPAANVGGAPEQPGRSQIGHAATPAIIWVLPATLCALRSSVAQHRAEVRMEGFSRAERGSNRL